MWELFADHPPQQHVGNLRIPGQARAVEIRAHHMAADCALRDITTIADAKFNLRQRSGIRPKVGCASMVFVTREQVS